MDEARPPLRQALLAALEALPEPERVAFVLKELEGWSTGAIAAEFGQSAAAVRELLRRARARLQEGLALKGLRGLARLDPGEAPPPEASQALQRALVRLAAQGRLR